MRLRSSKCCAFKISYNRCTHIHKLIQKLVFGRVSLAANFWSSLVPCYSAMVTRSRRKNWRRFLSKNQLLNQFVYTDCVKDRLAGFYHWDDRQGLNQALDVCMDHKININKIREWSEREGF